MAWAGLIFFLSAQPDTAFPDIGILGDLLPVLGHLIVYAVLMALLIRALRPQSAKSIILALVLVALYAFSDEFHQSFVPGRNPTLFDWLTDIAGALLAWLYLQQRRAYRK